MFHLYINKYILTFLQFDSILILVSILLNIQVNTEDLSLKSNQLRPLEQFKNKLISINNINSERETNLKNLSSPSLSPCLNNWVYTARAASLQL